MTRVKIKKTIMLIGTILNNSFRPFSFVLLCLFSCISTGNVLSNITNDISIYIYWFLVKIEVKVIEKNTSNVKKISVK